MKIGYALIIMGVGSLVAGGMDFLGFVHLSAGQQLVTAILDFIAGGIICLFEK